MKDHPIRTLTSRWGVIPLKDAIANLNSPTGKSIAERDKCAVCDMLINGSCMQPPPCPAGKRSVFKLIRSDMSAYEIPSKDLIPEVTRMTLEPSDNGTTDMSIILERISMRRIIDPKTFEKKRIKVWIIQRGVRSFGSMSVLRRLPIPGSDLQITNLFDSFAPHLSEVILSHYYRDPQAQMYQFAGHIDANNKSKKRSLGLLL